MAAILEQAKSFSLIVISPSCAAFPMGTRPIAHLGSPAHFKASYLVLNYTSRAAFFLHRMEKIIDQDFILD